MSSFSLSAGLGDASFLSQSSIIDREIMSVLAAFAPAYIWSEHLFSWSFTFATKCCAFAASLFQPRFLLVVLRSEVVFQSSCAGIHSSERAGLIVSLLCCGVHFFNDLTIVRFHFCLCKLNWSLTAGCLRRERWACCFSMELGEDGNSVRKTGFSSWKIIL